MLTCDWSSDVCSSDLIKQDMAKGRGEFLDSLSTLMEIPPDQRASFYAHAQSRYPFVVERQSSAQETLVQRSEERRVGKEGNYRCLVIKSYRKRLPIVR